jgi:N-acetylmuramoyl-L-alanine amidase
MSVLKQMASLKPKLHMTSLLASEGRLLALGASVFLTRGPQIDPSEAERISLTNKSNADLILSLNCDTYKNDLAHGVATYSYGSDAHGVHSVVGVVDFASLVQREICARTDLQDCGVHSKTCGFTSIGFCASSSN